MQGQQERNRFDRCGFVSEIVVGKIRKKKFTIARALPEEFRLDVFGGFLRPTQQFVRRGFLVAQQNIRRLDLGALAGGCLDLKRIVVVGQDRGGFEGAVFFKQYVHRRDYRPQNSKSCGNISENREKPWLPPSKTACRQPA